MLNSKKHMLKLEKKQNLNKVDLNIHTYAELDRTDQQFLIKLQFISK